MFPWHNIFLSERDEIVCDASLLVHQLLVRLQIKIRRIREEVGVLVAVNGNPETYEIILEYSRIVRVVKSY